MSDLIPKDTVDDMWRSVYGMLSAAWSLAKQLESHAPTKMKESECEDIADCIARARALTMRYNRDTIKAYGANVVSTVDPAAWLPDLSQDLISRPEPQKTYARSAEQDPVESAMELL